MTGLTGYNTEVAQADSAARNGRVLRSIGDLRRGAQAEIGRVGGDATRREQVFRRRIDELVGLTFYGTLLKTMRSSALKSPIGHGGRGEEIFQGQLDQLLAQRAGQAKRFHLSDAIYRQLTRGARGSSDRSAGS